MARFRPRGNKSQRIIGKAVGKGISAAHRQNNSNKNTNSNEQEKEKTQVSDGGMLVSIISMLIFFLILGLLSQ